MDASELRYLSMLQRQSQLSDLASRNDHTQASAVLAANPPSFMGAGETNAFRNTQQNLWNSYAARAYQERVQGGGNESVQPMMASGGGIEDVNKFSRGYTDFMDDVAPGLALANYDPSIGGAQLPDEYDYTDPEAPKLKRKGRFVPISPGMHASLQRAAQAYGGPITSPAMLQQQIAQERARKIEAERNTMLSMSRHRGRMGASDRRVMGEFSTDAMMPKPLEQVMRPMSGAVIFPGM